MTNEVESGFFFIRRFLTTYSISLIGRGISVLFFLKWTLLIYTFQEIVHFIFISLKLFVVLPHCSLISKICIDVTSPILDSDNLCLCFFLVSVDSGLSTLLIFQWISFWFQWFSHFFPFPTSFAFTLTFIISFPLLTFGLIFYSFSNFLMKKLTPLI